MNQQRVGVIMGGTSYGSELSLRSGQAVAAALGQAGHRVISIEVSCERQLFAQLQHAELDVAFLALQGGLGAAGRIQALLELLGVPYTGSDLLSSALSVDTLKGKELLRLHNVPTLPYYTLGTSERERLLEMHGSFGYPVMVKPRRRGTVCGASKAHSPEELLQAVELVSAVDDAVLVERFVTATQLSVGLLHGRVLGAVELASATGTDSRAARNDAERRTFFPTRLPASRLSGVMNLAERAGAALDCRGAVLVDVLVTQGGNEYVLEVNTAPEIHETSVFPRIAAAAGYDFGSLCHALLDAVRGAPPAPRAELDSQPLAAEPMRIAV